MTFMLQKNMISGIVLTKESGIKEILRLFRVGKRKNQWNKLHPDSDTIPMNEFNFENVPLLILAEGIGLSQKLHFYCATSFIHS